MSRKQQGIHDACIDDLVNRLSEKEGRREFTREYPMYKGKHKTLLGEVDLVCFMENGYVHLYEVKTWKNRRKARNKARKQLGVARNYFERHGFRDMVKTIYVHSNGYTERILPRL